MFLAFHIVFEEWILVNLIALLVWLFLVFNCIYACGGSVKAFFQFGMQKQTTSLLPRLQAQCGSSLYIARLQSGRWRYMNQDNRELRQNDL